MASIYDQITLSWEGKEVEVRPTFRMVQKIESRGISIFGVYQSLGQGEPRVTQVAEIICELLMSGGVKSVTPEKVYQRIVYASQDEWSRISHAIVAVFMPRDLRSGNSRGLGEGAETQSET